MNKVPAFKILMWYSHKKRYIGEQITLIYCTPLHILKLDFILWLTKLILALKVKETWSNVFFKVYWHNSQSFNVLWSFLPSFLIYFCLFFPLFHYFYHFYNSFFHMGYSFGLQIPHNFFPSILINWPLHHKSKNQNR